MSNMTVLSVCLIFTTILTSCSFGNKETGFLKKYSTIEGADFHTPTVAEALDAAAKMEGEATTTYQPAINEYHDKLKGLNVSILGCPCSPPMKCQWTKKSLESIINQNDYFKVDKIDYQDESGNILSSVAETINSPGNTYTVFIMGGVENITEKLIYLSILLKDETDAVRLPIEIVDN